MLSDQSSFFFVKLVDGRLVTISPKSSLWLNIGISYHFSFLYSYTRKNLLQNAAKMMHGEKHTSSRFVHQANFLIGHLTLFYVSFVCLFVDLFVDLILYVSSTIFQSNRDGSSWVEPVLS